MALDKYVTVRALVSFRERLILFKKKSNEKFIDYLNTLQGTDADDYTPPTPDEIAKATGLPRAKVVRNIHDLYIKLIDTLNQYDWQIKKVSCSIWIHLPYDEVEALRKEDKQRADSISEDYVIFACNPLIIPRIGEEIDLTFIDRHLRFTHGHVYNVSHRFHGATQEIHIHVHPHHKPYKNWMREKERAEADDRWWRSLQLYRKEREKQD